MKVIFEVVAFCKEALLTFVLIFVASGSIVMAQTENTPPIKEFRPAEGFVPTEEVALTVARAVLSQIYGKAQIQSEEPLKAKLVGDVWIVEGCLPANVDGGVATIRIARWDAKILSVSHSR